MNFLKSPFELIATFKALNKSQAIIEFNTKGIITYANENFLNLMGYKLHEIKGKHHHIFIDEKEKNSDAYRIFWEELRNGKFLSAEYKRFGKNKKEVWIEASYNPLIGITGKPYKIIKYATDITKKKLDSVDVAGQLIAINKSHAVITFSKEGIILY